jgi:hypothetical protein
MRSNPWSLSLLLICLGGSWSAKPSSVLAQPTVGLVTVDSSFAPLVFCDAEVVQDAFWFWSDGTMSTNFPDSSVDFGFSGIRSQSLFVDPHGAISQINIGFDGSDGGWANLAEVPPQGVLEVNFIDPLTNLIYWASSYNPITNTLDFTGFSQVQDIECFHCTNLQHAVVHDLPSLRRVCFENCQLQELDLSGDPELEDVRGALNSFTNVVLGSGTGPKIWHWCTRDNPQLTRHFQEIMTNFYSLRELWIWNDNQSGALTVASTNLVDFQGYQNAYVYADFTGQRNLRACLISENNLTNLVVGNCFRLTHLEAQNNQLTTSVLDTLLAFLDTHAKQITNVNLSGNAEFPSSRGYAHAANLVRRGATVILDHPETPPSWISVSVQAAPPDIPLVLDGKALRGPRTFIWLSGATHALGARSPQTRVAGGEYLWAGWSDSGPLSHLVAPRYDTIYTASFVPNPFIPVRGAYYGLFYDAVGAQFYSSGFLSLNITSLGAYSGTVQIAGRRYALGGQFALDGRATKTIARPGGTPLTLTLALDLGPGVDRLTGTVSDGTWSATLEAFRSVFDPRTNPATLYAGKYTLVIPGDPGNASLPGGSGYGTLTVNSGGHVIARGRLADGTSWSQVASLSKDGRWPLYLSLYGGRGAAFGWTIFASQVADDFHGELYWTKPALPAAGLYPAGFTNAFGVIGSIYTAPVSPAPVLDLTSAFIEFSGGNLPAPFVNSVTVGANSRVMNNSSNRMAAAISPSTGTFTGAVVPPGSVKAFTFGGAFLQKRGSGYGFLTGTGQSGQVYFGP